MTKLCPNCGSKTTNKMSKCNNCGKFLKENAEKIPIDKNNYDEHKNSDRRKNVKSTKSKLLLIILTILLGPIGGHHMYLGFYTKALKRTFISLLLVALGLGALVVIYSFFEAIGIYCDSKIIDAKGNIVT